MTHKIIIAKPGFDAKKETNPDNIIFSSEYNTLKYYLSDNRSITIAGDGTDKSTVLTIAHNLGYVPFFIVFVDDFANGISRYAPVPYINNTLSLIRMAEAWADDTNLYLKMRNKSTDTLIAHFYYKIFKNKLF